MKHLKSLLAVSLLGLAALSYVAPSLAATSASADLTATVDSYTDVVFGGGTRESTVSGGTGTLSFSIPTTVQSNKASGDVGLTLSGTNPGFSTTYTVGLSSGPNVINVAFTQDAASIPNTGLLPVQTINGPVFNLIGSANVTPANPAGTYTGSVTLTATAP